MFHSREKREIIGHRLTDLGDIQSNFESQRAILQTSNHQIQKISQFSKLEANNIKLRARKRYPEALRVKRTSKLVSSERVIIICGKQHSE